MRTMRQWIACFTLIAVLLSLGVPNCIVRAEENTSLSDEQKNAIAMLNYITVLTQEINASKNSRMYLEEAYSSLINNTYPNAVDSRTLRQMQDLMDIMDAYRMISVKRDRLHYVHEQSQAQAIRAAVPNPKVFMIGIEPINPEKSKEFINPEQSITSVNPVILVASIAYMAVDSYSNYTAYTTEMEKQYLNDGWSLDDKEIENLQKSREKTFTYMVEMVNQYSLPGDLTLTEDVVKEFVDWKNSDNLAGRIRFLESNQKTYQLYGGYWLTLADSYYRNGDYQKCIEAVAEYENMGIRIFRRDFDLARVLPFAIVSAKAVYNVDEYVLYASERVYSIIENTKNGDWALRYVAAQILADLYAATEDVQYLREAYEITVDNVNYLASEQRRLNTEFLDPVVEKTVSKDKPEEKKQIEQYNKVLKENRKTELPPVYEPLALNCELLFALADEMDLSTAEKAKVDSILHVNDERLFLVPDIDDRYWFDNPYIKAKEEDISVTFEGSSMTIPAQYVTKDAYIEASVAANGRVSILTKWVLEAVERGEDNNLATFTAHYTYNGANNQKWEPNNTVCIAITPDGKGEATHRFYYLAKETKSEWYEHIRVWEPDFIFERID